MPSCSKTRIDVGCCNAISRNVCVAVAIVHLLDLQLRKSTRPRQRLLSLGFQEKASIPILETFSCREVRKPPTVTTRVNWQSGGEGTRTRPGCILMCGSENGNPDWRETRQ